MATGLLAIMILGLAACGGSSSQANATPADAPVGADGSTACEAAGPVETMLVTDDGVQLVADLYTTEQVGGPGVILLHMIPPSNTKANYAPEFIEPLVSRGFHVLNVNRRGAPGSDGDATDAYTGPNGKLDAKAAYDHLTNHACAVAPSEIAVVGASNGTTTVTDFSVFAAADPSVEQPAALVFLSGGAYTENQNAVSDNLDALGNHPIYFAYPPGEAGWNEGIQSIAPGNWTFVEYAPGAHGTNLFTSNPESIAEVADFIDGIL